MINNEIQTISAIQKLDVDTLPAGEYKLNFAVATNAMGEWQHLPIRVFKGAQVGKKIMITAGVHGDEQNGIMVAMKVAQRLVDQAISGCVTIVPTINQSGILHHSRDFYPVDPDVSPSNLNRYFPGNENGNETERYLASIWNHLLLPNADLAIDLHTQTTGTCYPLYVFADYRIDVAKQMAHLMNPDVILDDPGDKGVLESTWNQHLIPSITVEVGSGRYYEADLVDRSVEGVLNILRHHNVIEGESVITASPMEGKQTITIKAISGGFVETQVSMMQQVNEGDLLAIQYSAIGDELARYHAPESGLVLSHNLEALRAAGSLIVRLIK